LWGRGEAVVEVCYNTISCFPEAMQATCTQGSECSSPQMLQCVCACVVHTHDTEVWSAKVATLHHSPAAAWLPIYHSSLAPCVWFPRAILHNSTSTVLSFVLALPPPGPALPAQRPGGPCVCRVFPSAFLQTKPNRELRQGTRHCAVFHVRAWPCPLLHLHRLDGCSDA